MNGLNQDTELNKIPESEIVYAKNSIMSNARSQQYYSPGISDFYIGCEFEISQHGSDKWETGASDPTGLIHVYKTWREYNSQYRIPYLTAEQIEAEGWTQQINENIFFISINSLCGYRVYTEPELHSIEIERVLMDSDDVIYKGPCRCINDFRLICKLLNIN
jgi:hypothetical protein